jgi:hypothetical protein
VTQPLGGASLLPLSRNASHWQSTGGQPTIIRNAAKQKTAVARRTDGSEETQPVLAASRHEFLKVFEV